MYYTEKKAALVVRSYQVEDMAHTAETHEQMNTDYIGLLVQNPYPLSLIRTRPCTSVDAQTQQDFLRWT